MEMPPAEIIDRMSITKLKIERIGEMQLKQEYEEYKKAIEEFEKTGIKIKKEWFEELYEINGKIWDQEFVVRKIAHEIIEGRKLGSEDAELEEIGKRYIVVGDLMRERVKIKNKISEETGRGFKEIKIRHCAE